METGVIADFAIKWLAKKIMDLTAGKILDKYQEKLFNWIKNKLRDMGDGDSLTKLEREPTSELAQSKTRLDLIDYLQKNPDQKNELMDLMGKARISVSQEMSIRGSGNISIQIKGDGNKVG